MDGQWEANPVEHGSLLQKAQLRKQDTLKKAILPLQRTSPILNQILVSSHAVWHNGSLIIMWGLTLILFQSTATRHFAFRQSRQLARKRGSLETTPRETLASRSCPDGWKSCVTKGCLIIRSEGGSGCGVLLGCMLTGRHMHECLRLAFGSHRLAAFFSCRAARYTKYIVQCERWRCHTLWCEPPARLELLQSLRLYS